MNASWCVLQMLANPRLKRFHDPTNPEVHSDTLYSASAMLTIGVAR
jgi:hypothetical protein